MALPASVFAPPRAPFEHGHAIVSSVISRHGTHEARARQCADEMGAHHYFNPQLRRPASASLLRASAAALPQSPSYAGGASGPPVEQRLQSFGQQAAARQQSARALKV
jgi:hypothetical protein